MIAHRQAGAGRRRFPRTAFAVAGFALALDAVAPARAAGKLMLTPGVLGAYRQIHDSTLKPHAN